jgi:hypothetical protein
MKTPIKEKTLTIDTEGQVKFTRTEKGELNIELFQQRFMRDDIERKDAIKLAKWLIENFI